MLVSLDFQKSHFILRSEKYLPRGSFTVMTLGHRHTRLRLSLCLWSIAVARSQGTVVPTVLRPPTIATLLCYQRLKLRVTHYPPRVQHRTLVPYTAGAIPQLQLSKLLQIYLQLGACKNNVKTAGLLNTTSRTSQRAGTQISLEAAQGRGPTHSPESTPETRVPYSSPTGIQSSTHLPTGRLCIFVMCGGLRSKIGPKTILSLESGPLSELEI